MRVFFLAEKPCALTVNGAYLGIVDGFERSVEISPSDGVFCELAPSGYLPVRFRLDEDFLFCPPNQIELYYARGAVAVYCKDFIRSDPSLTVLWQETLLKSRLTLIMQGKLQLNLENETGFHIVSLPEWLEDCKAAACGGLILLRAERGFALVTREGEKRVLSEGNILEAGEHILRAELPLRDSLGRRMAAEWTEGEMTACSIRARHASSQAGIALALFESVLLGADVRPYLTDALQQNADRLRGFLGEFVSVVCTDVGDVVGLVFPRRKGVFDVRYFRTELEDGKVANVREI